MAIGKGSMARAAKAAKDTPKVENVVKEQATNTEVVKTPEEKKVEAAKPEVKKAPAKKTVAKNPAVKSATAKKTAEKKPVEAKASVVTPTKQVMDMVNKDRVEIGDEMPIYLY